MAKATKKIKPPKPKPSKKVKYGDGVTPPNGPENPPGGGG